MWVPYIHCVGFCIVYSVAKVFLGPQLASKQKRNPRFLFLILSIASVSNVKESFVELIIRTMNIMKESILWRNTMYALWTMITLTCAFFIVYDAQWLLGDDAIVMRFIGWGNFFPASHTICPESGRFFPFSYLMYNLLPCFLSGQISATAVYAYQAIWFIVFAWMSFYLVQEMLKEYSAKWRYAIALCTTIFLIGRYYPGFINCYSTSWFGAVLNVATILFANKFYTTKKWFYGLLSLSILIWMTYCSEVSFVVPLAWGVCALPLWKESTKNERVFHLSLIANAFVFLVIYFFAVYLKTVSSYDGAHGEEVTLFGNAIKILMAQKFLWVVMLLFGIRVWDICRNSKEYTIYDVLILVAAAHCLGGFILKLNWVLYYNRAIVIALPAVIYFATKYTHQYVLFILMALFAAFYGAKVPKNIQKIREDRNSTFEFVDAVVRAQQETKYSIYLFSVAETDTSYDGELIRWLYDSFETYYGYAIASREVHLQRVDEYNGVGIYITVDRNDVIVPNSNERIIQRATTVISSNTMRNMGAWILE